MTFGDQKDKDWFRPGQPVSTSAVYEVPSPEKQKFEEIKQKAWELQLAFSTNPPTVDGKKIVNTGECQAIAWGIAEDFYKFAKEKEEEK